MITIVNSRKVLRDARESSKFSMNKMMMKSGVSAATISRFEAEKSTMTVANYIACLNACGYDVCIVKRETT